MLQVGACWTKNLDFRCFLPQPVDPLITAAGTLVGLVAILIEELERAGSLHRESILARLDAYLQNHPSKSPGSQISDEWLSTEIIRQLSSILATARDPAHSLTIVGGTDMIQRDHEQR